MLVGIIIGIVSWQMVVGIAQWKECSEQWWVAPIPAALIGLVYCLLQAASALANIRVWLYVIRIGINPFRMKVAIVKQINLEQREEILKRANGRYKQAFKRLFKIYSFGG